MNDKSVEIVIVDGASSDSTVEIIQSLQDNRIRIITSTSYGYSYQRNIGARHARGKYLLYLSGDAYISNRLLDKYYLELGKFDVIQGTINNIPNEKLSSKAVFETLPLVYKRHLTDRYEDFSTVNVCIRKSLLLERPFNEKLKSLEDKEWFFCLGHLSQYKRLKSASVDHDVHENTFEYGKKIYKEAQALGEIVKTKVSYFWKMNFFNWLTWFYSYALLLIVMIFMLISGRYILLGVGLVTFTSSFLIFHKRRYQCSMRANLIYFYYTGLVFLGILTGLLKGRNIYEGSSDSGTSR